MKERFKSPIEFASSLISASGMFISLLATVVVVYNIYGGIESLPSTHRITISALLFITLFTLTSINKRLGLLVCVFLLPLLPTLTIQILNFTGYGRILHQESSGLDLISGFVCGCIINQCVVSRGKCSKSLLPWPASLLIIFITLSTAIAVLRNLSQTSSPINFYGFLYSLSQFRTLDWHDDFRPLFDWVAYGVAIAAFGNSLPILRSSVKRNHLVFKPLMFSLLISATVGLIQNRLGFGLTHSQLQFRSKSMSTGYDITGFTAIGFQPDIHSYAGVLMIGTCGLLGYWYYSKNKIFTHLIPIVLMPLAFLAMLASKSKSSVVLTIIFLFFAFCIWYFRKSPYLKRTLIGTCIGFFCVCASFYFFQNTWTQIFTALANRLGFTDLYALNFSMAFRPEIFIAAFRMFAEFPLMGLGQGDFYRLSAIPNFSHSPFLTVTLNGENSHNYFIQVLTENGIVGFVLFCLFIFYPINKIKNKTLIIPAFIGLCSILLGNLYSHSLLVRENLLLCSFFIALIYAWLEPVNQTTTEQIAQRNKLPGLFLLIALCSVCYFAVKETRRSFSKFPFTEDYQCFRERPLTQDGWTSGLYKVRIEPGASGTTFSIKATQPNPNLTVAAEIVHPTLGVISATETNFKTNAKNLIMINMPAGQYATDDRYEVVLKIERCYIPKNWGISNDPRKLGIQIDAIKMIQ